MKAAAAIFFGILAGLVIIAMVKGGFALSDRALGRDNPLGAILVPVMCFAGMFLYGRVERMLVEGKKKDDGAKT
jgi:hypothetical protein